MNNIGENIAAALVKAQSKLHNLGKNASGYGYEYLTLDKLIHQTRAALAAHGLAVSQILCHHDGKPILQTMLVHESGESLFGSYPLEPAGMAKANTAQQMGAAITYARRYALAALLNIAQSDDDAACLSVEVPQECARPEEGNDLREWFAERCKGIEAQVDQFLQKIGYIEKGQDREDLTAEQLGQIKAREDAFFAKVPQEDKE